MTVCSLIRATNHFIWFIEWQITRTCERTRP
jgi:hypothetical protein